MPTSSTSVAVKICGITSPAAIDTAVSEGAAYGGLVFHPKSPRNLDLEQANALARHMRGKLKIVTLVADPSDAQLAALTRLIAPDFLQLHGGETVKRVAEIRARFGVAEGRISRAS